MGTLFCRYSWARYLLLVAFVFRFQPDTPAAEAEFLCRAELSVKWKKQDKELNDFVTKIERKGPDEPGAKRQLELAVTQQKPEILERCRRDRENVAGCVSAKLEAHAAALKNASFSARKQLEEAVVADCKERQGSCLDALASDPVCEEIKKAEDAEAKNEPKKDEKAKGKKK